MKRIISITRLFQRRQFCSERTVNAPPIESFPAWWDIENQPILDGHTLEYVVDTIKRVVKLRKIEAGPHLIIVGPKKRVMKIEHEFERCKVSYIETQVGYQIADNHIKRLMKESIENNKQASCIVKERIERKIQPRFAMLIGSDSDYVEPLEELNKHNYQVLLVARLNRTKREMIEQAKIIWYWEAILDQVDQYGKDSFGGKVTHPISEIVAGWVYWRLEVRVIRLWTVPKYKYPQRTTIEMILLDEKLDRIHCSVNDILITQFQSVLEEGQCFRIEKLKVDRNDANFARTTHKFKLSFLPITECFKIENDCIPANNFFFISFADILAAQKEQWIIDIIGHVVKKSELQEKTQNAKFTRLIKVVLEDLEFKRLQCTLYGEYAEMMAGNLNNIGSSSPPIVILQLCKLKRYQGYMGIENAFYGTKLFIDADLEAVKDYKSKLEAVRGDRSTEQGK